MGLGEGKPDITIQDIRTLPRMDNVVIRRLAAVASVAILIVIVFATLAPIQQRPRLPLPVDLERGMAFAALAFCLGVAFGRSYGLIAIGCVLLAGGLEWLQTFVPTRHGQGWDFEIKALGSVVGIGVAFILRLCFGGRQAGDDIG